MKHLQPFSKTEPGRVRRNERRAAIQAKRATFWMESK